MNSQCCAASGCGEVPPAGNFNSAWKVLLRISQEPKSYAPAGSSTPVTLVVPMVIALLLPPVTALWTEPQPATVVATRVAQPRAAIRPGARRMAEVMRSFSVQTGRGLPVGSGRPLPDREPAGWLPGGSVSG